MLTSLYYIYTQQIHPWSIEFYRFKVYHNYLLLMQGLLKFTATILT